MIQIMIQSTHSKVFYNKATEHETLLSEKILREKFVALDKTLIRDPRVKRGLMSPYTNFYNVEYNILPTGLLKYLFIYYKKSKLEYKIKDLRKFPGVNKKFLKALYNNEIVYDGNDDKKYIPRDYQIKAILKIAKQKGGGIQLPTGSGKGFIAALICYMYSRSKILFIFDSIDLIHQTRDAFINKYGIPEKEVGIIQGPNYEDNKRITLLSMMSYEKAIHIFPQAKVIVMDEAHKTGRAETAQKIIYSCQSAPIHIGLSATIDCIDNPVEQMRLYSIMGPIIYEKEMVDQIKDGILSDLDIEIHTIKMLEKDAPRSTGNWADIYKWELYDPQPNEHGEIFSGLPHGVESKVVNKKTYLKQFVRHGDESTHYVYNSKRNKKITELAKSNERVLILYTRKTHGLKLKELMPESVLISGDDTLEMRKQAEEELENNKNAIVLASNIWSKGKDLPWIETYINASGGVSTILTIQKMGRATRKSPETGKEKALIIDFWDGFSLLGQKQSQKRFNTYKTKLGLDVKII